MYQNNNIQSKLSSTRNAYYHGHFRHNQREGPAIAILDNGDLLVAHWEKDGPTGKAIVFLGDEEYGLVEYRRGEMEGWACFCQNEEMLVVELRNGRVG